jgi:hypothetical protein
VGIFEIVSPSVDELYSNKLFGLLYMVQLLFCSHLLIVIIITMTCEHYLS